MRLREYLESRNEKPAEFARRAKIPTSTLHQILTGSGATVTTALRILGATHGDVQLEDLQRVVRVDRSEADLELDASA